MTRLPSVSRDDATPEQRVVFDSIVDTRGGAAALLDEDGGLIGPFNALVTSPEIGERIGALGEVVRFNTTIDRRLLELAIITAGAHWRSNFEFYAHSAMALTAGVDQSVIDAIATGSTPDFARDDERIVYSFVHELMSTGRASDSAYVSLVGLLGDKGAVDIVATAGYYSLISLTLNAFAVPVPPGVTPTWPD